MRRLANQSAVSSRQRARSFFATLGREAGAPEDDGSVPVALRPPRQVSRQYRRHYARWLWPYRWKLSGLFLLALIVAALDMVWPLLIKHIIDGILAPVSSRWAKLTALNATGLLILAILIVKQGAESLRVYRMAALNATVLFRLRRRLFERLLHLSLGALSEMKSGGIVSRLSADIDAVSGLVQQAIIAPSVALLRVLLTLAILFFLSWRLAVGALVMIPPMALLSFLWIKRVKPVYRSAQKDRIDIDGRVNETFGGIRVVRSFRREAREARTYAVGHHTVIRKWLFAQQLELLIETGWGFLVPLTMLLVVWYGGWLTLHDPPLARVGDLFAFQIYAVLLLQPVWQIVSSVSQTQKSIAAMERVFEVLDLPPDKPDAPDAVDAPPAVGELKFTGVAFAYRPGKPVLENFDLTVQGGWTVALVGPSGGGKTTLTDLVARFQDPTAGSITLNGIDLRQLRLQTYRSLLAVVQQDVFLFDGSVRQNIAYGRRGASDADIEDAARRANAHAFIAQLPEGYDTLIGERGLKLSGGQRQRLSIARAILANPRILILDEATSNLDTESEQLIQASLAELFKDRTTFVIAHRLSTVAHADLIVALDEGRIREVGSHEELMARQAFYFEMVERQQQALARMSGDLIA